MSTRPSRWVVYWLFDERCVCPWRHGCIGATGRLHQRLHQYRESKRFTDFEVMVLFRGSREDCLRLEAQMRPSPGIGWNVGRGGFSNGSGLRGVQKSASHREKQRKAALRRYANPAEHAKTQKAVKHALKSIDRSGANNSRYGKRCTEETKQRIRDAVAARGGLKGQLNPNYRHGRYSS